MSLLSYRKCTIAIVCCGALIAARSVSGWTLLASPAPSGVLVSHLGRRFDRRNALWTTAAALLSLNAATGTDVVNAQDAPRKLEFRTDASTGVMMADIRDGSVGGNRVESNSKVNLHITGRLLGKNGWIFENSQLDGEPYRLQLGVHRVIPGLEIGLLGMTEGGKRRIVVPSQQGYLDKELEPIPRDFGNRQRLYTTVMNSVRVDRERSQLGSDLAGKVVIDVELLRIR